MRSPRSPFCVPTVPRLRVSQPLTLSPCPCPLILFPCFFYALSSLPLSRPRPRPPCFPFPTAFVPFPLSWIVMPARFVPLPLVPVPFPCCFRALSFPLRRPSLPFVALCHYSYPFPLMFAHSPSYPLLVWMCPVPTTTVVKRCDKDVRRQVSGCGDR